MILPCVKENIPSQSIPQAVCERLPPSGALLQRTQLPRRMAPRKTTTSPRPSASRGQKASETQKEESKAQQRRGEKQAGKTPAPKPQIPTPRENAKGKVPDRTIKSSKIARHSQTAFVEPRNRRTRGGACPRGMRLKSDAHLDDTRAIVSTGWVDGFRGTWIEGRACRLRRIYSYGTTDR